MDLSNHPAAHAVTSVPAYCGSSAVKPQITTPAQWATCAKIGWDQPTTTAAHVGQMVGHAAPVVLLVILVIVALVVAALRSARRATFDPR
jgi:hypothetical protein